MSKVILIQASRALLRRLRASRALPARERVEEISQEDFVPDSLAGSEGAEIDAIVLGDDLEEPIRLSQRIHSVRRELPVLILAPAERCMKLQRAIQFAPFLGSEIACQALEEPEGLEGRLRDAIEKSRKRRRYELNVAAMRSRQGGAEKKAPLPPSDSLFFERLLNHAPVGILSLDAEGRVMTWNPRAVEILGTEVPDMLGVSLHDLLHPKDAALREGIAARLRAGSAEGGGEALVLELANGPAAGRWVELRLTTISGRSGELGGLALLQDVTGRVLAETQLKEAVKMRDDFISLASHELKTPITALQLQNQVNRRMLAERETEEEQQERLERMAAIFDRQLGKLASLVEDMLDVSRLAAGRISLDLQETDLVELARDACRRMEASASNAGCELTIRTPDEPVLGFWDGQRLEQVILNLLGNAFKYGAEKPVTLEVGADEETAFIRVMDQGVGIAREDQARIFEQFERAASLKNYSGFGLGLFISRRIIEEHGGRISVASQPGSGAAFSASLPRRRAGSEQR